jgi:inner membrane transporter RhtA
MRDRDGRTVNIVASGLEVDPLLNSSRAGRRAGPPPTLLVLAAIISVQIGAGIARGIFAQAGFTGVVLLRLVFGALVLGLVTRPRFRIAGRQPILIALAFGATLACMNLSFYAAIDRAPLGVVVTLEFVGPLTVATIGSRRLLDLAWVVLAAAGVVMLASGAGGSVHVLGIVLAFVAGGFWALYIALSARIGRSFPGTSGLVLSMATAAVLVAPIAAATHGPKFFSGRVLAIGLAIGVLSTAIPWTLELQALRRIPIRVFGVMMSLEPAVAAVAGFLILRQHVHLLQIIAIALVIAASAGVSLARREPPWHDP